MGVVSHVVFNGVINIFHKSSGISYFFKVSTQLGHILYFQPLLIHSY